MPDDIKQPASSGNRSSGIGPLLGCAFVMLVAYFLSIGPIQWLADHGYIDHDNAFLNAFYAPLGYLAVKVPLFGAVFLAYIFLWVF